MQAYNDLSSPGVLETTSSLDGGASAEGDRLPPGERKRLVQCLQRLAAAGVVARLIRYHRGRDRTDGELERWAGRAVGLDADKLSDFRVDPKAWDEDDASLVRRCFAGLGDQRGATSALAAAQAAVRMLLGEKPRRRLGNVPLLLVVNGPAGSEGRVARLALDLWPGGFGEFFPSPRMLRSFGPEWLEAIKAAWQRVPFPAGCDVQWEVDGEAPQMNGASAQAAFQVALIYLLEGYSYDPHCALSARVDDAGRLLPVQGLAGLFHSAGPKLFAARGAGVKRVVLSRADFQGLSPAAREALHATGVSIVAAATVAEALPLAQADRTLDQYLRERRLKPRQAAALTAELARSLDAARQRGILYLNIRPETIVVDPKGRPHFMDLGVARLGPIAIPRLRQAEESCCSYQAPEQGRGESERLTHQTDIFALGAVLYYLLVGKAPFTGKDPAEVGGCVARGDFDRVALQTAGVPRPLVEMTLRALAPQPADRYETAGSLSEDLERFERSLRRRAFLRWSAGTTAVTVPLAVAGAWWVWPKAGSNLQMVVSQGPLFTKDEPPNPRFKEVVPEDRWLSYEEAQVGSLLRITYSMPYLEKYSRGGPVDGVEDSLPFAWNYPNIALRITNNSPRTVLPTRAILRVSGSQEERRPLLVVLTGTSNHLWFENEGWGEAIDPVVHFRVASVEKAASLLDGRKLWSEQPTPVSIDSRRLWKLRLKPIHVPEQLSEMEEVGIAGVIEYGSAGRRHRIKFQTQVRLQLAAQHAVPPSFQHHVLLRAGKADLYSISLSGHAISPTETELTYLRIGSDRTATYRLNLMVYSDGDHEIGRQDLELSVFVPRSQAAEAAKNIKALENG